VTVTENEIVVGRLVEVAVGDLVPDPTNRPISEASIDALVPSIVELGVLEPILTAADGRSIVDGERRWRAATKAGLLFVPVLPTDFSDRRHWVMASTVANFAREEPHPLDAGARLKELQELGFKQGEIALLLGHGWSQPQVSNRILVVDGFALLPDDLRATAEAAYRSDDDLLTVRQAEDLARLVKLCAEEAAAAGEGDGGGESFVPVRQVLDMATKDRKGEIDRMLAPHLAAARRRELVRKERAAVAAEGLRDATDDDGWADIDRLAREIGTDLEGHDQLPCHAVVVDLHGTRFSVCTDPGSHRAAVAGAATPDAAVDEDDDDPERFRTQDEIAEAEKADAKSRPVTPEQEAAAQERVERRERAIALRDGWPARLDVAKAAMKRSRSAAKVLEHLVLALAMDQGNVEWLEQPLLQLLGLPDDTDASDLMEELVAQASKGGDAAVQIGAAMAWAAGETSVTEAARCLDVSFGTGAVHDHVTRAFARYVSRLAVEGYELSDAERITSTLAQPKDADAEDHDDAEPDGDGDVPAVERLRSKVEAMHAAASALRSAPSKGKKRDAAVASLEEAKAAVVAEIVSHVTSDDVQGFVDALINHDRSTLADYEQNGSVKTDDDLARYTASQKQFVRIFADAGVPLDEALAEEFEHSHVVRSSWTNEGMPQWVRIPDLVTALGATWPEPTPADSAPAQAFEADVDAATPVDQSGTEHEHRYVDGRNARCRVCSFSAGDEAHWDVDGNPVMASVPSNLRCEAVDFVRVEQLDASITCPTCGSPAATDEKGFVLGHLRTEPIDPAERSDPDAARIEVGPGVLVGVLELASYMKARAELIERPKSTPRAEAFETAKRELAAALVSRHPDVFELTSELSSIVDGYRRRFAEIEGGVASPEGAEVRAATDAAVVAALRAGGEVALPAEFEAWMRDEGELEPNERPEAKKAGANRRLYVDDLLDACGARP
jgi:ParB/RepB/Spo0J family partition protein